MARCRAVPLTEVSSTLQRLAEKRAMRLNQELFIGFVCYKMGGFRAHNPKLEAVRIDTLVEWLEDYERYGPD